MKNILPVSQHQIAAKLGISQATVSMALAGNPRVAKETRDHIIAAAAEMEYQPDPGLRALGRYRRALREPNFHATLGWVHNLKTPDWWHQSAVFRKFFDAAQKRAARFGYTLEDFWIDSATVSPLRATEILRARGISGLLLLPTFDEAPKIELDWQHFTVVRIFDYQQGHPTMHLVGADHYATMQNTLTRVLDLGYRRPGLVTSRHFERCFLSQYTSAYFGVACDSAEGTWPEIHHCDVFSAEAFTDWLRREKPDVLILAYISQHLRHTIETLRKSSLRVPEDIGIAMLCLPDYPCEESGLPEFSGVNEQFELMGERAIELLVGQCENFERGLPETSTRHLIGGIWQDGNTLRSLTPKSSAPRKASRSRRNSE